MSLQHFFLENQILAEIEEESFSLHLREDDLKHARVLRLKAGEHIAVIDAAQDYFECEIARFEHGVMEVRIAQHFHPEEDKPLVVLAQGLAKGDKMEQIIRQTTELGIGGFVPFICERSIVKLDEKKKETKAQRWQQIAKSASMQSGQRSIPEVSNPMNLFELCSFVSSATAVIICWEEASSGNIGQVLESALASLFVEAADARVVVVVGPEGGLTKSEVFALLAANPRAQTVTLGPSILRTETAGVVASALVLYELGGLQ